MRIMRAARGLIVAASVLVFVGCAAVQVRSPVPSELVGEAEIPGIPKARFWGDEWPRWLADRLTTITDSEAREQLGVLFDAPHNYLAISGGGANGAFGAGLLAGWTESGKRPEFTVVTGISTGALTAPFAYLGSEYDDVLKEVYTTISTKDIAVRKRPSILSLFRKEAVSDTAPLRALIEETINAEVIAAIAEEYRSEGRTLFIGTVNLDSARSVIWNIGEIANSDYPRRHALIHDILQASSAFPIAFPPVMIPVSVGTETYDEMHVDGGAGMQVFMYPAAVDFRQMTERLKVHGQPKVYVIRNANLNLDYAGVQRTMIPIAQRSISSLIRTQGIGDLYQIHSLCMRDGNEFNLAYIPADFKEEPSEAFDPVYMKALFERGFEMGKNGYDWKDSPPGYRLPR
ncbi:MAG: patatin-like phospholipase family protein, partial [Woeseiaceae bacterium]